MTAQHLEQLLDPYLQAPLTAVQSERLLAYLELLLKWNAKINLTAIRDPEQIVPRHFGESLALAHSVMTKLAPRTAADLGSGAGFPGLPLSIYAPDLPVTLVESQNKKATFLKEVVRTLGLHNVTVRHVRGEELSERFDVVTIRAVERFEKALQVAAALRSTAGHIAMLVSAAQVKSLPGQWITQELPGGTNLALSG